MARPDDHGRREGGSRRGLPVPADDPLRALSAGVLIVLAALAAVVAWKLHRRYVADPRALRTLAEALVRISEAQRTHHALEGAYTADIAALAARDPRLAELVRARPWGSRGHLALHLEDEAGRAFTASALAVPYGSGLFRTFLFAHGRDGLRWYDAGREADRDLLPISPDDPPAP